MPEKKEGRKKVKLLFGEKRGNVAAFTAITFNRILFFVFRQKVRFKFIVLLNQLTANAPAPALPSHHFYLF